MHQFLLELAVWYLMAGFPSRREVVYVQRSWRMYSEDVYSAHTVVTATMQHNNIHIRTDKVRGVDTQNTAGETLVTRSELQQGL